MDTASRPNFGAGAGGDYGRYDNSGTRYPYSEKPGQTMGSVNSTAVNHNFNNVRPIVDNGIKTETSSQEENIVYPGPFKLFCITLALCLAVFLVALDQTIIATAVPKITDEFKALNDIGWYGSAYMFTVCSFQLLFAKYYTFYSLKWTFLGAIGIFEVGSLVCGIAPNSSVLIVGRAIAGLGCSGIFSGALIILAYSVSLKWRPVFTGIVASMYGISSVLGPILGGIFTDSKLTWRWCFYINLPVGAISILIIVLLFTPPDRQSTMENLTFREKMGRFDLLGTACLVPAIVTLLLALQWGGSKYKWENPIIISLLVLFVFFTLSFIAIQFWKQENGTLPPRIIGQRSIAAGALFSLCFGASFFMLIYYLPLWFQAIQADSPVQSGIKTLPLILAVIVMCGISGGVVIWVGYYTPMMILASAVTGVGAGLLTTWTKDADPSRYLGYQAVTGIGLGLGIVQPLIAAQTVLSMDDIPVGTTTMIFCQSLGGAIFIAAAQTIFNEKFIKGLEPIFPGIKPELFVTIGATNLKKAVPPMMLDQILTLYNAALVKVFNIPFILACSSIIAALAMEWRSVKGVKLEMTAL